MVDDRLECIPLEADSWCRIGRFMREAKLTLLLSKWLILHILHKETKVNQLSHSLHLARAVVVSDQWQVKWLEGESHFLPFCFLLSIIPFHPRPWTCNWNESLIGSANGDWVTVDLVARSNNKNGHSDHAWVAAVIWAIQSRLDRRIYFFLLSTAAVDVSPVQLESAPVSLFLSNANSPSERQVCPLL